MLAKKGLSAAPSAVAQYVEDVFNTYVYSGQSSGTITIDNGIDLSGEGGLVWIKQRNGTSGHQLCDTERGITNRLQTNTTGAQSSEAFLGSVTSTGFTLPANYGDVSGSTGTYTSWTFRKAEKFFDVVTYTGTGSARTVSHNLGSTPGFIIVKRTDDVGSWACYHTSIGNQRYLKLESTAAQSNTGAGWWNNTSPTSTEFTVGTDPYVNSSGATYVAYLFAHDAGGFGASGSDNVISCGSYTGNGSTNGPTITLGYEPQWILYKVTTGTASDWEIVDNMRGLPIGTGDNVLFPNTSGAEVDAGDYFAINATGFKVTGTGGDVNASGATYIYIAIRRGPMKTPEAGTEVFSTDTERGPATGNGSSSDPSFTSSFTVDLGIQHLKNGGSSVVPTFADRLRGSGYLVSSSTNSEIAANWKFDTQTGYYNSDISSNSSALAWMFRRAPGFFDVVCYTGTGSVTNFNHSLGVAPELWITKRRDSAGNWTVGSSLIPASDYLFLHTNAAKDTTTGAWDSTYPTSSVFTVGTSTSTNTSGGTYVAYLFASVTGVSKVGSYTGNGSSQTINCGFTAGARFVLIKATSTTGDWVVFDSARGIVSGNDPYLELNTTDAEVTDKDAVDTDNTGFVVNETTGPNVNTNSATYIYLAIA